MDKEYGTMFKRLMHERNELRKYIIDICKLLDIDTRQSVLGANCLEFYAVLSSVAKDKVKDLQEQLKRKEEELQAQRNFTAQEQRKIYCAAYDKTCETGNDCKQEKCIFKDNIKLKQTLTEIKEIAEKQCNICEALTPINEYKDCKKCWQGVILQKIRECEIESNKEDN